MAKVTTVSHGEADERSYRKSDDPKLAGYKKTPYHVDKLPYFPVTDEPLQLFEIELGPDTTIESHAHSEDEIIYVLSGTITLGARSLGPGDSLFVAKNTLYGFKVGSEGVHFLNFRPNPYVTYMTKDDYLAKREGRPEY